VILLPQPWHPGSSTLDTRVVMRHYTAALDALRASLPDAEVVVRPHPADPLAPVAKLRERHPQVQCDVRSEIGDVIRTADLCIGGTSTATLQAAIVGTPVVILNISGHEWRWPLGGATPVPVARNREELERWIERWSRGESIPGREQLLAALGVDGGDATERLLRLLEIPGVEQERTFVAPEAVRS
jgi:hypothetical protein